VNEAFNHWIVHRVPFVTVKAAMTLDGKIATERGESKWITGPAARTWAMTLRQAADAILVGVNTVIQDDPQLVVRSPQGGLNPGGKKLRRLVLDSRARTPTAARILNDEFRQLTTIVVGECAPSRRVHALSKRVPVLVAPSRQPAGREPECIDLPWLLDRLGAEQVTSLLVEGGGEVNASFLLARLAHKVAFFYAPTILGGAKARRAVGGDGAASLEQALKLDRLRWRRVGPDWLLNACVRQQG
jgi:diaminohydroxyphosphoribosylaminopyrimidine deaminase/5-amino-6-(5-phosphoribosylamino)uracil reductase